MFISNIFTPTNARIITRLYFRYLNIAINPATAKYSERSPRIAKAFDVKTRNGSCVTARMAGIESTKAFIETLSSHDLIEPAQFNITFADGEQKRYEGMYTVNDEKLGQLTGDSLQQLHKRGYLQACHLLLASLGQVQRLIGLKNERRSAAG